MAVPVFAYWHDADQSVLAPFIEHWRQYFPQFQVLSDQDIVPLINRHLPEAAPLYPRLRLPAAKSDIGRLIALYAHGGLYVDCKCVIRDRLQLSRLIKQLETVECIVVDRALWIEPRRLPLEHDLINSMILARPGRELLLRSAQRATKNLECQYGMECSNGYVEYNIAALTGAYVLGSILFEPGSLCRELRPEFSHTLIVPEEEMPIARAYFSYGPASMHWSERQKDEKLFA
jgi:hypothetical protein